MVASDGTVISYRRAALDVAAPATSNGWTFAAKVKIDTLPGTATYLVNGGDTWAAAWKNNVFVASDGTVWASCYSPNGAGLGTYDCGTDAAVFTAGGAAKTLHVVCDITQAAADDKIKIYVDGVQQATTTYENVAGSGPVSWTGNVVTTRFVFNGNSINHTSSLFTASTGYCLVGQAGFYFFDFEPITDTTRFYNGGDVDINTIKGTGAFCLSGPVADWNAGTNNLGDAGDLVVVSTYTATSASHNGAAALTGTGSQSATGARITFSTAALAGSGAQVCAGTTSTFGVAALAGTGSAAISGTRTSFASANISATGSASISGTRTVNAVANLSGTGSETISGVVGGDATANLTATGAMTASGSVSRFGVATLAGTSGQSAIAWLARFGAASLSSVGSMVVAGSLPFVQLAISALRAVTVPPEDRSIDVPNEDRSVVVFEP